MTTSQYAGQGGIGFKKPTVVGFKNPTSPALQSAGMSRSNNCQIIAIKIIHLGLTVMHTRKWTIKKKNLNKL